MQFVFYSGQQFQIEPVQLAVLPFKRPADCAGVDQGFEGQPHTTQGEDAAAISGQVGDQAADAGFAIRGDAVGGLVEIALVTIYAGVIGFCPDVVNEFFLSASFSAANIFDIDSGASMTSSRNEVLSAIR